VEDVEFNSKPQARGLDCGVPYFSRQRRVGLPCLCFLRQGFGRVLVVGGIERERGRSAHEIDVGSEVGGSPATEISEGAINIASAGGGGASGAEHMREAERGRSKVGRVQAKIKQCERELVGGKEVDVLWRDWGKQQKRRDYREGLV
jgi:hypothetical protein